MRTYTHGATARHFHLSVTEGLGRVGHRLVDDEKGRIAVTRDGTSMYYVASEPSVE